jgi:tyrosyl-tRNA synthetase
MVHGAAALESAERITAGLFDGALVDLSEEDLRQLALDGMDCTEILEDEVGLLDLLTRTGWLSRTAPGASWW